MPDRILVVHDFADVGGSYSPLLQEFGDTTSDIAAFKMKPFDFKLVFFTGGEDVSPELYGDTSPKRFCYNNPQRDKIEKEIFKFALDKGIKMAGICRGMQFLNVMSGGKMIHHLDGHGVHHDVQTTSDNPKFKEMNVNSMHHQMAIPASTTTVLAWARKRLSNKYIGDKDEEVFWPGNEVEAIYNSTHRIFGVQWHPEVMPVGHVARDYFMCTLQDFLKITNYTFKAKNVPAIEFKMMGGN